MNNSTTSTNQMDHSSTNQMDYLSTNQIGHSLSEEFALFAATCFSLIIVTSIVFNSILIVTILSAKKLHSVSHVFIVNLAISDLITVIGTVPFDVDFMLRGQFIHGKLACGIMQTTFLLSLPSSVFNLCLLTAERLITVLLPFHFMKYLTNINITIAVISSWSYTLLVALFPIMAYSNSIAIIGGNCVLMYPVEFDIFQLIANFLLPILFICFANVVLFSISNKHASRIQKNQIQLGSFVAANNHSNEVVKKTSLTKSLSNGSRRYKESFRMHRKSSLSVTHNVRMIATNVKAAKRIALLVGVFLLCWLTYIILVATNISCDICHPREVTWIGNIINYSSTAINPLLYGILSRNIRQEVLKIIRKLFQSCCSFEKSKKLSRSHGYKYVKGKVTSL